MFISALKQTIFPIRSKLLVYNRQHLFSKSHIYRSPSLRFTEAPTSNPLGKRWRSLSRFPWKTVSSGTSNAVAASARYHATSPSSLIKSRVPSTHSAENHDFIFLTMGADHQPQSPCSALRAQAICRAQAPYTHALTALLSLINHPSPFDGSCGSLCFRYCHVLLSIVFQVLWRGVAWLEEVVRTRDYWAVTKGL